ncbi:MAG: homocysteine S-methyltransferase family protein [Hyphomicrobiales bacterium]
MKLDLFKNLLEKNKIILADGATGTNILKLAKEQNINLPAAIELLNLETPDLVSAHHLAYINAGSDVLLTNTWAANKYALQDRGVEKNSDQIRQLNREAAQLLNKEISKAQRVIVCAGSVGPTDYIVAEPDDKEPSDIDLGYIAYTEAVSVFTDQIIGLLEGGVDVIWIESQINPHEVHAAIDALRIAIKETSLHVPFVVSMVFNPNEQTQTSYDLEHFAKDFGHGDYKPIAFGVNCGFGPEIALENIINNKELWEGAPPLLVKANWGSPRLVTDEKGSEFKPLGLSSEQVISYAQIAFDCGIKIVGGCCGSLPDDIAAMRSALDVYTPKDPPPISEIQSIFKNIQGINDG